jgi:hypothetical protein
MSLQEVKTAIKEEKLHCPTCHKPVKQFDKFVEMLESAYDGPGSSLEAPAGSTVPSKVTLICGNDKCEWRERTEYWRDYIQ